MYDTICVPSAVTLAFVTTGLFPSDPDVGPLYTLYDEAPGVTFQVSCTSVGLLGPIGVAISPLGGEGWANNLPQDRPQRKITLTNRSVNATS
jgi:hypothetical protein